MKKNAKAKSSTKIYRYSRPKINEFGANLIFNYERYRNAILRKLKKPGSAKAHRASKPPKIDFRSVVPLEEIIKDFTAQADKGVYDWIDHIPPHNALPFALMNPAHLLAAGLYEKLLYFGYISVEPYILNLPPNELLLPALDYGSRETLLKAGDPLPGPGPFVLYRGIPDPLFEKEMLARPSWTASPEVAAWFAVFETKYVRVKCPVVYRRVVDASDVYFYCNERNEQEFVIKVRPEVQAERLWELPTPQLPGEEPLPWSWDNFWLK